MSNEEYFSLRKCCKERNIFQNKNDKKELVIEICELLTILLLAVLSGNILPYAIGLSLALLVALIFPVTENVMLYKNKKLMKQQLSGIICREIAAINQQQISYSMVCQNDIMKIYLRFFSVSENIENASDRVNIDLFFTESELKDIFYKQIGQAKIGRIRKVS